MPTDRSLERVEESLRNRIGHAGVLAAAAGAVLLLGACAADRNGGYTHYPDRWEYRQGPSDNYGRIYRY